LFNSVGENIQCGGTLFNHHHYNIFFVSIRVSTKRIKPSLTNGTPIRQYNLLVLAVRAISPSNTHTKIPQTSFFIVFKCRCRCNVKKKEKEISRMQERLADPFTCGATRTRRESSRRCGCWQMVEGKAAAGSLDGGEEHWGRGRAPFRRLEFEEGGQGW
jgi:hypothetical protein